MAQRNQISQGICANEFLKEYTYLDLTWPFTGSKFYRTLNLKYNNLMIKGQNFVMQGINSTLISGYQIKNKSLCCLPFLFSSIVFFLFLLMGALLLSAQKTERNNDADNQTGRWQITDKEREGEITIITLYFTCEN